MGFFKDFADEVRRKHNERVDELKEHFKEAFGSNKQVRALPPKESVTKKMPIGSSRKMPPMKVQAPPTTVIPVQNNTNENSESSKSTELQEYRQHQELQQQELERRITEEEWALEKDSHSFQQRMFEKKLDNHFTLSMADKQLQNKESERRHEERMYELDNEARRLENERMRIENDRMIIEENIQRSQNVNNSFFRGNDNDMM